MPDQNIPPSSVPGSPFRKNKTPSTAFILLLAVSVFSLAAPHAAAQCNPSFENCGGTPGAGPDIGISPDGGTYTAEGASVKVRVSIFFSDADGLNAGTRQIGVWRGTPSTYVPVSLAWTLTNEGRNGSASGEIEFSVAGDNVLVAQMSDIFGNAGVASSTFKLTIADPNLPVLSLDPHHNEFRDTSQGSLVLSYPMASYTSMGVERTTGLLHSSELARPAGMIQVDAYPAPQINSVITTLSLRVEKWNNGASGTQALVVPEIFYKNAGGRQRLASYWWWTATQPTGAYRAWAVVRAYKADGTYFETRKPIRFLILNERSSRYGAGWIVAGVKRLYASGSDGVMLSEGNGILRFFTGACAAATVDCAYTTPDGDFSKLTYRPATKTWLRTYTDGSQEIYSIVDKNSAGDRWGGLTSSSDRFGNTTTVEWQYAQDGTNAALVSKIVDPVGHATTFAYDASWYLRSVTAVSRTVTCTINSAKQLTHIAGPPHLQLTYDSYRQVSSYNVNHSGSATDPGVTTDVTYNDAARVATITAAAVTTADGQTLRPQIKYKSIENAAAPVAWWDVAVTRANPANGVLSDAAFAEVTDAGGHTTKFTQDRYGNVTRVVDALGNASSATWTPDGLLWTSVTPTTATENAWNSRGQLLGQMVNGTEVYSSSANLCDLPEFVESGGVVQWFAYGPKCEVVRTWYGKKEDEQRTATKYEYNARYQLVRTIGPQGEKSEWSYEGNPWRNADYARVTRQDGTVATTSFTYDAFSRLHTAKNALNQTTTIEYDGQNRPIQVVNALGKTVSYTYTGPHLTKVTDPLGKTHELGYNALGWLLSEKFPGETRVRTYAYDIDGLVSSTTDRRGQSVSLSYDATHRPAARVADGMTTTYGYPDGHTTVVSNNESVVRTSLLAGVGLVGSVTSTLAGRSFEIKRAIDMSEAWRDYGFDLNTFVNGALQRTEKVRYHTDFHPTDTSLSSTYQIEDISGYRTTMSFDISGRPVRTAFPNGVTQYNWFTSDGRLDSTTYNSSTVDQKLGASYSYDLLGRLGSRTSRAGDRMWSYGYDSVGEVTQYETYRMGSSGGCDPSVEFCPPSDWLPIAIEEYGYDASGNRTDRGAHMEIGSNRYTDFNGFALNYDAEGNLTRKFKSGFDQTFTWNSLGQLTSVTTNGATVTYGYDGHGVRVRRTANGQSQYFVYDGDDLLLETDQNGNPVRTYTHWPGTDHPHSVRVTSFGQNFVYYYTSEHPGNVTGLLSTYGAVAGEHHYKPFGEVESSSDDAGQPLRFMGRELDFATGLYYVRNRWYDPTLARFISQDPIGLAGGLNTYAYVENDPVNGRDPSGLRNTQDKDPIMLDPIITGCERLWSWGWDHCYSNYIFDLWAKQRQEQDTDVTPRSPCPWLPRGCSFEDPIGNYVNERLDEEIEQARQNRVRQAARRASREACRAQNPPRTPGRIEAGARNAAWNGIIAGAGYLISSFTWQGKVAKGVGTVGGWVVGEFTESEGDRLIQQCEAGLF